MPSPNIDMFAAAIAAVALTVWLLGRRRSGHSLPTPPGPKGLPLVGNVADMPQDEEWLTYAEWGRKYGSDLVYLNVMGSSIVVVNTAQAALELFERRGTIYSDRPRFEMGKLSGYFFDFSFWPYTPETKDYRKMFHHYLGPAALPRYRDIQLKAVHGLLRMLLEDPSDFNRDIRAMAANNIFAVVYGLEVEGAHDPYVKLVEDGAVVAVRVFKPGEWIVDSLPMLKYIPEWFPGAGWKRTAREYRQLVADMVDRPFDAGRTSALKGEGIPVSFIGTLYSQDTIDSEEEKMMRQLAGAVYVAAIDTIVSSLSSFLLCMVQFPEAQRQAQAELDSVLGGSRLPTLADQESLPYIQALINEVWRYCPPVPLGLPHTLREHDTYNGYSLPAGSVVLGNIWAMLRDEAVYPEPNKFLPGRFLKDGEIDPDIRDPTHVFGFGRRICPGQFLAREVMWLTVASLLVCFDMKPALDEHGKPITPAGEFVSVGIMRNPAPFKYNIVPRSGETANLVVSTKEGGV